MPAPVASRPSRLGVLQTYLRLGLPNIARVFAYRIKKSAGYFERTMPIGAPYEGPFFGEKQEARGENLESRISHLEAKRSSYTMFSHIEVPTDAAPDWFVNPVNGERCEHVDQHWSKTKDFSAKLGDIKCVWEVSRFDWLPQAAWEVKRRETRDENPGAKGGQAPLSSDPAGASPVGASPLHTIETWVADWVQHNPMNLGPNWRCGQEVSIRAMNFLLALKILDQIENPTPAARRFLAEHARRIVPTLGYAVGQDTNHATSEAVALFLIGHYLALYDRGAGRNCVVEYETWQRAGRYCLEERVRHLFAPDGTFAQYSVNYHRLALSTLALAEAFLREWQLAPLSDVFYKRARSATNWLSTMTDRVSGDAPNIGPNDGADLFNVGRQPYRDFRPALKFARAMFLDDGCTNDGGPLCDLFAKHALPATNVRSIANDDRATTYKDGGFVRLAPTKHCWGVVRYANFKVRPKEADILHLDLWRNGINVVRDGGSYSYASAEEVAYFSGTACHSTMQFDDRDQMRRIGRFLFGDWITMQEVTSVVDDNGVLSWSAGYTDYAGASHTRSISASNVDWIIRDTIRGFQDHAVIRWRLCPLNWSLNGNSLQSELANVTISSEHEIDLKLTKGRESRRYLESNEIPVLEVTCRKFGTYTTKIEWR